MPAPMINAKTRASPCSMTQEQRFVKAPALPKLLPQHGSNG
jgi:hypothetical protein